MFSSSKNTTWKIKPEGHIICNVGRMYSREIINQQIDEGPWYRRNKNIYQYWDTKWSRKTINSHYIITPKADKHQKLPLSYTKEEIPVNRSEIATPATLKQWQYLEKISSFLGENDNISVDLFIGANFVEAFQLLEVIPSQQDGPYGYRTILG